MQPIWTPDEPTIARSNIQSSLHELGIDSYPQFYDWSIKEPRQFWSHGIEKLGIRFAQPPLDSVELTDDPGHPHWLPGARLNIAESCFQANPSTPAILHAGPDGSPQTITYAELRRQASQIGHSLQQAGLAPGDAVAVFMPMTARSIAIYLGIVLAGYVVVSVADSFSAEQLRIRLDIGQAKRIFTAAFLRRNEKQIALYERVVQAGGPPAILLDHVLPEGAQLRAGDICWPQFLCDNSTELVVHTQPDAPINVLFSSGTTGEPKAIPWDHTVPIKAASDGYFHQDIHPADVVAWPTNLGWMMGPWLIFATLINKGCIALFEGSPLDREFGTFVQNAQVNVLGVIPSLVRQWQASGCMDGLDWSAIRLFSSTGECSNPEEMQFLSRLAGGKPIIEYCGGTELGGGYITSTVVQPNYPSTFSTPALGSAIEILDEQGHPADAGELFLHPLAMGVSQRLLNRDHDEAYYQGVPSGPQGQPLRRHGDQMQRLPNGYFRALGRADDTMNLGGIKVGAAEIEQVLAEIPGIRELAAIAVSQPNGGPSLLVICVARDMLSELDTENLQAAMQKLVREKLNPLFKIHDLFYLDQLPRTASNKILRRTLRSQYEAHSR